MATVQPGEVIGGRYQLEHIIGSGGMSTVWAAHDRLLDRRVAVKILSERYASDPDFVERFRREASAAAGLSHPNIVGVYDRGESAGSYYIVMEHLPGPDLKAIIRQRGRLDPRQAVDAALQVLAALGAAHRRDVIHRDVKPQNVMVAEDGLLKVTDFGIARAGADGGMTEVGAVIGTAQYLSPEQARGEEVTPASDCYAVGILLYEMLTGKVPFDGDTPVSIAMRQINETPVSPRVSLPTLSPTLSDIVMKALEKRPGARYRTVEEFTQALLAVRETLPESVDVATQVIANGDTGMSTRVMPRQPTTGGITGPTRLQPPGSRPTPPPPPPRRRWPAVLAILAALLVAGAAAAFVFTDIGRAKEVVIPSVATQSVDDATAELEALGLEVRQDGENNADVPAGRVIRTDPEEGSTVKEGDTITLIVSEGRVQGSVPDVANKKYEDAAKLLTDAGFNPVRGEDAFSDAVPLGEVISQNPVANTIADRDTDVTVVVSKGPDLVTVPALLLEDQSRAKELLENADLTLGDDVLTRETSRRPPGTIVDQDPTAGQKVKRGSAVSITVAKAPEPSTIEVPDVVGQEVGAATNKLKGLGFAVTTEGFPDPNVPEGTVTSQNPAAGTQFDPTSGAIRLDFSIGPDTGPPTDTSGTP